MNTEMKDKRSDCCGATMYNYNDGLGICSDCKEWSESEADFDEE